MKMKIYTLLAAAACFCQASMAQLKATPDCPVFKVDVLEGTVNEKLDCSSTAGEIQKIFPCFSSVVEETNGAGCGAVVYNTRGITFFTERDYIEIQQGFKGNLEPALMGVSRTDLFKLLGNPKLKDENWDAFHTKFGLLILYYDKAGKINKLQITNKNEATLKLCE